MIIEMKTVIKIKILFFEQFCSGLYFNKFLKPNILICENGCGALFHDQDVCDHEAHDLRHVHGRDHSFALRGSANDCVHDRVHGNVRARVHGCAFCHHDRVCVHERGYVHVCAHVDVCDRLP